MEWKDIVAILAGGIVILVFALVVKPALLTYQVSGPGPVKPLYSPPAPVPTATPFPEDAPVYTRSFRWTAVDGGVYTTEVRVPEALFDGHRETPRFDRLAWGRYALDEGDRPIIEDLARRIAPPTTNPEKEYYRLMDLIFFVQQIPYAPDSSPESYREGVLPRHAVRRGAEVEYPKYPTEMLVDGKGDCEDSAILMAALLDALGYDTVLLGYPDHMVLGIQMEKFNPYYAKYTPKYFNYGGKHYYPVEGTDFVWTNVSSGSPARLGKPNPIGDAGSTARAPTIIPLRYTPAPAGYRIHPALLPAGGG
ncbi:MAG: transglutaminase domain-containing protein [Methanomicrobiales archaeon]|nr:transglutaminase domain-containing protein [Methanomicrobiales archaeon]